MEHRSSYAPTTCINTFSHWRLQYCQNNTKLISVNVGSDLRYQQKLSEIHEAVDTSHQILQFIDIPSKLSYKFRKNDP